MPKERFVRNSFTDEERDLFLDSISVKTTGEEDYLTSITKKYALDIISGKYYRQNDLNEQEQER